MYDISQYIIEIGCLNQNSLIEYIKNKSLSIDPFDIPHTIFFKKLHVLLQNLPSYLKKVDLKINENKDHFVNSGTDFLDNKFFDDTGGYIRTNCSKLTNNNYMVKYTYKNGSKVVINLHIKN